MPSNQNLGLFPPLPPFSSSPELGSFLQSYLFLLKSILISHCGLNSWWGKERPPCVWVSRHSGLGALGNGRFPFSCYQGFSLRRKQRPSQPNKRSVFINMAIEFIVYKYVQYKNAPKASVFQPVQTAGHTETACFSLFLHPLPFPRSPSNPLPPLPHPKYTGNIIYIQHATHNKNSADTPKHSYRWLGNDFELWGGGERNDSWRFHLYHYFFLREIWSEWTFDMCVCVSVWLCVGICGCARKIERECKWKCVQGS